MLDLKKLFRAVITLMLISLVFTPMVIFAQTEGQTLVKESGLSVKWIEPKMSYKSIDTNYLFSEGLGVIRVTLDDNTFKYGIADEVGEMVTPIIYDETGWFSDGLCYVRTDSKKIFIDKAGKEILDVSNYDSVGGFRNGFAVTRLNEKFGLINKLGYEILPCDYDPDIYYYNNSGLIWARKDGLYGCFDSSGKEISGMVYNEIGTYGVYDYEFMVVKKDVKWGVVDNQANVIIPIIYDYAMACDEEIVALRKGDKWEYVNVKDENITPFQFDYPKEFSEGLARVKKMTSMDIWINKVRW